MLQSVNNISTVGMRHFQVARTLRDIEINSTFIITVVQPKKAFG